MKGCPVAIVFALVVALVGVSGCSSSPAKPASDTPTSSPPSSVSTPPSQKELQEAATAVYRRIYVQELKLQHAGGADELPPAWTELVTGQLATDIANAFRAWKRNGTVSLGPDPVVMWIRPYDKTM